VSINLIGREFIHTDATASVAVQTFSTPTALVVGTSVDDTNVVASKISLDVAALDTTPYDLVGSQSKRPGQAEHPVLRHDVYAANTAA
jgi:hypothetical protein